jgi:hypothetical protein
MTEPKWKKFLAKKQEPVSTPKRFNQLAKEKKWRESDRKRIQRDRKTLFDIRKRAINAMLDLTFILENLPNISKHPTDDFARIFRDEMLAVKVINKTRFAFYESFNSKNKFNSPESNQAMLTACVRAGITPPGVGKLADRHYRSKLYKQLKSKTPDGENYYEEALQRITFNKYYKLIEENTQKDLDLKREKGGTYSLDPYQKTRESNAVHIGTRVSVNIINRNWATLAQILEEIEEQMRSETH